MQAVLRLQPHCSPILQVTPSKSARQDLNQARRSTHQSLQPYGSGGIDLAEAFPKPLTDDVVQAADVVITMGCGDACPVYPGKTYLDWSIADPVDEATREIGAIVDEIDTKVRELWSQLQR